MVASLHHPDLATVHEAGEEPVLRAYHAAAAASLRQLSGDHRGALRRLSRLRDEIAAQDRATRDGLTGLFDRRHFFDLAEHSLNIGHRYDRPVAAAA